MEYMVKLIDLPCKIKGFVTQTFCDGENFYTIVLNASLNKEQQMSAFFHEVKHIKNKDFDKYDVQEIEAR